MAGSQLLYVAVGAAGTLVYRRVRRDDGSVLEAVAETAKGATHTTTAVGSVVTVVVTEVDRLSSSVQTALGLAFGLVVIARLFEGGREVDVRAEAT